MLCVTVLPFTGFRSSIPSILNWEIQLRWGKGGARVNGGEGEKKGKRFESGMRWLRDNVLREMMKIKRREWNIVEIED